MRTRLRHAASAAVLTLAIGIVVPPTGAPGLVDRDSVDPADWSSLRGGGRTDVLIAAHRGEWRAAPENSLAAVKKAIADGAEVVEVDVRRTRDGRLVLMHDETVDRTTNGTGRVADLTLAQIEQLRLKEGMADPQDPLTDERVPTLNEVMLAAKGHALVNLDKGWDDREQILQLLRATGTVGDGLFKGSPTVAEASAFMAQDPEIKYMHVVDDANAGDIGAFTGRPPIAYEILFDNSADVQAQPRSLETIHRTSAVWINSMWPILNAGHTDQVSLRDPALGWGSLVDSYQADIIQTDDVRGLDRWRDGGDPTEPEQPPGDRAMRVEARHHPLRR
jgi:glycerophosphoryl diester phosphodiesterase